MDCLLPKIHILLTTRLFFASLTLASLIATGGCASLFYEKINIRVTGGLMYEQEAVYVEAQKTRDFFRPLGLGFPDQLKVVLTQQVQSSEGIISVGRYNPKSNSIFVLDYQSAIAASRRAQPAFGIPMNISLWRSYLVHEIAHAIAEKHSMANDHTLAPTEYIAAVAQLSTLPDETLDHLLSNYRNVPAFEDEAEITDLFYFMKPCEFVVKAYLHYSRPENGQAFILQLLHKGLPESGVRGNIPFF